MNDRKIALTTRGRIFALMLRHYYLYRGSWPRIIELAYWPLMQIFLWGFISQFFQQHSTLIAQAGGLLLAGVMLWDVMFRGQLGVSVSFLEELWARNLGQMFVSPLRPVELAAALMCVSLVRTLGRPHPRSPCCLASVRVRHHVHRAGADRVLPHAARVQLGRRPRRLRLCCCGMGSVRRASPGSRSSRWHRFQPSITQSRSCRNGCNGSPSPLRPRMCLRACGL